MRVLLRAALAAVVVAVLALLLLGDVAARRYDAYLAGLWVGDPAFLAEAHLQDFQLFIAPSRGGGRRSGYLIMTGPDGFISNQAIEITERPSARRWWSAVRSSLRVRDAHDARDVGFEYDEAAGPDGAPMPAVMRMTISISDGTLTLYDGSRVYAFLEKDLAASAAAVLAYGA